MTPAGPIPNTAEVIFTDSETTAAGQRAVRQGNARRIGRGILTTNTREPLERVVRRNWASIAAHAFPGATLVDRSFFDGGPGARGVVMLDVGPDGPRRTRPFLLPGLSIYTRTGPGAVEGDVPYLHGLRFSSQTRGFLDNLRPSRARAGVRRTLTRSELEARLVQLHAGSGVAAVNQLRDEAKRLAPLLDAEHEADVLDALIGSLLGTRDARLVTSAAQALRAGVPFDQRRVALFEVLAQELRAQAPVLRPLKVGDDPAVLAFYEAYFSNYIEGTRFTIDEATSIVFLDEVPEQRPADAHDIKGTFDLIYPPTADARVPASADELLEVLQRRHKTLLSGRPEKNPGRFKALNNQAGTTTFVDWRLVRGTLREGFKTYFSLPEGFARAVFVMFLIAEVHPFLDGNGRIARVFMNAELTATGQERIVLPTGYRHNYLSALTGLTHNERADAVIRMLDFAHRYTAAIDWSNDERARRMLEATRAFDEDPANVLRLPQPWD